MAGGPGWRQRCVWPGVREASEPTFMEVGTQITTVGKQGMACDKLNA